MRIFFANILHFASETSDEIEDEFQKQQKAEGKLK